LKHGDIYWVDLADRGGREQSGRRPAVIWQDTALLAFPTVLIIPLTSRFIARRFPATHMLQPTPRNGLAAASVALVFQLGACDVKRFGDRIGELDDQDRIALQDLTKRLQKLP
jgi:mRNA-degrading endonuclease toxin of MazEF toxin-antitoxin module